MDVDDPTGEAADCLGTEDAHEAGQHHIRGPRPFHLVTHRGGEDSPIASPRNDSDRHPGLSRPVQGGDTGTVGQHQNDLVLGSLAVQQGLEVRP